MSATLPTIPGLTTTQQRERAESLLATAYRGGITDPRELANFMGQTQHESQNFTRLEENLNYRGSVLWDTFKGSSKTPPRNGLTEKEANELASIPDRAERRMAIADKIYGGSWGEQNLGNTAEHDGYNFRGRGYIQLTGRDNYERHNSLTGLDLVKNPGLAAEQVNAEKLAVSYWAANVQRVAGARTDVTDAGSIINTGKIGRAVKGLADRQANATAWETALSKEGYLAGVLERHPAQPAPASPAVEKEALPKQPAPPKPEPPRSPQTQGLILDSEHHVRQLAERHQLPWNQGMDNTVLAVASQASQDGLTGITHLKVADGQIRFAQYDGLTLKESSIDARAAANTDAQQSVAQLAKADTAPPLKEPLPLQASTRAVESPVMAL